MEPTPRQDLREVRDSIESVRNEQIAKFKALREKQCNDLIARLKRSRDEFERSLTDGGIYFHHSGRPDFAFARGGAFCDDVNDVEKSFKQACEIAEVSPDVAQSDCPPIPSADAPPLIGASATILQTYQELAKLRSRLDETSRTELLREIEDCCFWLGRYTERAFVRQAERAAKAGKKVLLGTAKGRAQRFGSDEARAARNVKWQAEIERLCALPMSYQSACLQIARTEGRHVNTVKNRTSNPRARDKK